jgi:SAM-dependent methyltransferase
MLLQQLHREARRPISVLEVGVGEGKLLSFMGGPQNSEGRAGLPAWIESWDGLDLKFEPSVSRAAYTNLIAGDIEGHYDLSGRRYDAVILIHVLEHLFDPEMAMHRLRDVLRENGKMIGGSPTMPSLLALVHQPWLRWKHRKVFKDVSVHRHLSVITPRRVKRFARNSGWTVEHLTGAFFLRSSGLWLENYAWWTRANLVWGAITPPLGAEVYFSLSKL